MTNEQMLKRISELESINDQLLTEIRYLDQLLREVGFEDGLKTLKFAAKEIDRAGQGQDARRSKLRLRDCRRSWREIASESALGVQEDSGKGLSCASLRCMIFSSMLSAVM